MEEKEVKLSTQEIKQLFSDGYSNENKYIGKYGEPARKTLLTMSNGTESIHCEKLNKDLTLSFALTKEKKELNNIVTFGAISYKIRISDGEKELGKCIYQLEPRGVHLSFIGLNEELDSTYQGIGLGSIMFAKLEEFCRSLGAEYIEGRYTPMGKFADSSRAFYERHGFKFEVDYEDHGRTYVKKDVERSLENGVKTSSPQSIDTENLSKGGNE